MIGLVDGNNFYVSCERIFNPSLEGKPVAVLSNNDGCVISRSNEFKALNITMGTPFFQLKPIIEKHGLILKSSNYELYGDISRRVIATLAEFTPDVEQYSIDEAFIHVNLSNEQDYLSFGLEVRETILKWIGIPCGVGFAKSKTLAKIANHIAKKQKDGVFVMPDNPQSILENTPVGEIWGVGRKLSPKLEALGIRNAWQLAMTDGGFLRKKFNVTLAKTALELQGQSLIEQEDPNELSQSISCSRCFGEPVTKLSHLKESIAYYIAQAAKKLRKEKQRASGVNIYYQMFPEYKPYKIEGGFITQTVTFANPIANNSDILTVIAPFLDKMFIEGRRYKKTGIVFFGLESNSNQQLDLFSDTVKDEKSDSLSEAIDKINKQFGKGTVFNLAEGIKKPWAMKREYLSPSFTTNWEQILKVK